MYGTMIEKNATRRARIEAMLARLCAEARDTKQSITECEMDSVQRFYADTGEDALVILRARLAVLRREIRQLEILQTYGDLPLAEIVRRHGWSALDWKKLD